MSEVEKAWKEWHTENSHIDDCSDSFPDELAKTGFVAGYARGRADAMELPEVCWDELEKGKWYLGRNILLSKWEVFQHGDVSDVAIQFAPEQFSFRGPLRFGEGK